MTAYVFAFTRPDGQVGAIADRDQRLVLTSDDGLAARFALKLAKRAGLHIAPVPQDAAQVATLVLSGNVAPEQVGAHMRFIESDAATTADAQQQADALAAAVPLDSIGDWYATHPPQEQEGTP